MLEIHQRNDLEGYSKYLNEFGLSSSDAQIIEAIDNNNVLGFSIFSYESDTVIIHCVNYNEDKYLCDGIIRTVLFKASLIGIDKAQFKMSDLSIAENLGFILKGSNSLASIQTIMNNCKNCKNSC